MVADHAPTNCRDFTFKQESLQNIRAQGSLLLATLVITLALALAAHHLAKHHHTVAVHEGNTGEALAVLEGVADQWLLWLEAALSHLVGFRE